MFSQNFKNALAAVRHVSSNFFLERLSDAVNAVEAASAGDVVLKGYVKKLETMIAQPNFALDSKLTNEFAQTLGEAHFYCMCLYREVRLERVPERDTGNPDFQFEGSDLFFEVKTPSVVGGDAGVTDALESNLDAKIHLEEQLLAGKRIAMAESVVDPYGKRQYGKGLLRGIINTLIEKTRQAYKADQFRRPNTFLVLNLAIIPPFRTEAATLRPVYCDDRTSSTTVSGELWMLAFCKPGMLVHCIPEFEGTPAIEGGIDKEGVLLEFQNIAGLLFMIHPWRYPAELWGLFRSADMNAWLNAQSKVVTTLMGLVGEQWNDDLNSNGWQLNIEGRRP